MLESQPITFGDGGAERCSICATERYHSLQLEIEVGLGSPIVETIRESGDTLASQYHQRSRPDCAVEKLKAQIREVNDSADCTLGNQLLSSGERVRCVVMQEAHCGKKKGNCAVRTQVPQRLPDKRPRILPAWHRQLLFLRPSTCTPRRAP